VIDEPHLVGTEEAVLRAEVASLRAALEAFRDLRFRLSTTGVYLDYSAPPDLLYAPPESFLGRHVRDVLPTALAERCEAAIAECVRTNGVAEFEYDLELPAGRRWFELRMAPVAAGEVVAAIRDVTDRVAAAGVANEREERFRQIVELSADGIWTCDDDGITTYASATMARMLGLEPSEMIGRPVVEFMDGDGAQHFRNVIANRRTDATKHAFTFRRRDGTPLVTALSSTILHGPGGEPVGALAVVTDQSDAVRISSELAEARDRIAHIVQAVDQHLYSGVLGSDGSYTETFSGPGLDRLLGVPATSIGDAGEAWEAAIEPEDLPAYRAFNRRLRAGEGSEVEYRLIGGDGFIRWVADRAVPRARDRNGSVTIDGVVTDITRRHELATELEQALADANDLNAALEQARFEADQVARTDSLTAVANRRRFGEQLAFRIEAAPRTRQRFGILLLDIDHFKHVNDAHGHAAGDAVLVEVARRLALRLRDGDQLARWGGEEFIVAADVPGDEALRRLGEDLRTAVAADPVLVGGERIGVTISVGAAIHDVAEDVDAIIAAADAALYAAKRRGRNRVVLQPDLTARDQEAEAPEAVRLAEALSIAVAVREATPTLHPRHVADLACRLARRMGLTSIEAGACVLGAWLHDIGKLALPDGLLGPANLLDDDARVALRAHASVGEEIVRLMPTLDAAAPIVRHHHERFNGTGYPDALAGDAIPIGARIVAVADAFCALTEGRPYHPAIDIASAVETIAASAAFDPAVAAALAAEFPA
jgi:diguanylate cyclase (GGDEF)-like protein/PAS domain S-box-containing protein